MVKSKYNISLLKKSWLLTTLLALSSFSVFSQTDTPEPDVKIKRRVAIEVVKDLTRYDSLQVRYKLLEENIANLKMISEQKDLKLREYKDSESRLNLIISNQSALNREVDLRYKALEKEYKREVRAGRFKLVLLGGAVAFALYQTFKR